MAIPHLIESPPVAQHVLRCTPEDAATLLAHLPSGPVERELPGTAAHAYLDSHIVKPWGHELRVYDDRWIDVWRLFIGGGSATSLHAHPRKDTWLICIGGEGVLVTGAGQAIPLVDGSVVHIGPGALHATHSDEGVSLLEVEMPRDKFDLLRIGDRYGRAGRCYEGEDASRRDACPLVAQTGGPPGARLRTHCGTGCFRFNLETGDQTWRRPDDLVVAIGLEISSVLGRELIVHNVSTLAAVARNELYLTVRRNA